jgi:signal transduction histidine kinase
VVDDTWFQSRLSGASRQEVAGSRPRASWSLEDREAVATLALALVEDISLEGAIQRILDEVRVALRAQSILVLLAGRDGATLELVGSRVSPATAARLAEISVGGSCFCARAFRTGTIQVVERLDPPVEGSLARVLQEVEGLWSAVAVPLRSPRGVIGTLAVGYSRPRQFSSRDRDLAQTLANVAAAGIQNARLYETTLRRERRGEIISEVLAALTATIDADQVPRRLVDVLLHAYGADRAWLLYPCDPTAATIRVPYEATMPDYPGANALDEPIDPSALGYVLTRALESDAPIALDLDDESLPAGVRELHQGYSVRSLLAVRLKPRDDRPWLLGLHQCRYRRAWTPEEVGILAEIAGYATVAIEHAQLYRQAQDALRVRDEFISSAAHELKTPVTAMKGYAQVLLRLVKRDESLDERFRRALVAIDHSADRITRLTHDLLEVSTFDSFGKLGRRGPVDLGGLACEAAADAGTRAGERPLTCEVIRPAVVVGNRDRLADAIYSLIDNAIRYSPEGSPIEVTVDAAGVEAVVSVRDYGLGIPEERWPYLFEPLFEPHPAGALGYVGVVSLGLYLARRIVEEHEGRIWFATHEGEGTTFNIAIPLAEAPAAEPGLNG